MKNGSIGCRRIGLLAALCAGVLHNGCSIATPNYDAKFGVAVREARLAMTVNPGAGALPADAPGMDGRAAREAVTHYQNSFKTPPPAVNVINLGGSLARP